MFFDVSLHETAHTREDERPRFVDAASQHRVLNRRVFDQVDRAAEN